MTRNRNHGNLHRHSRKILLVLPSGPTCSYVNVTRAHGCASDVTRSDNSDALSSLFCLYCNIDSLLNKHAELEGLVPEINPDIIALTEILPQNFTYAVQLGELQLGGL